jgi:hypothetical protein
MQFEVMLAIAVLASVVLFDLAVVVLGRDSRPTDPDRPNW